MAAAILYPHHASFCLLFNHQLEWPAKGCHGALKRTVVRRKGNGVGLIKAASVETPPIRLFEPLQTEAPSSDLEPADPDFYKIGFAQSFRACGVAFIEGPSGFEVYASRDVEPLRRARLRKCDPVFARRLLLPPD